MLILASNSPRRRQLMDLTGWDYRVLAAPVDESVRPGEPPEAYVQRLAGEKAQAVVPLIPPAERPQAVILAADTAVVLEDEILGKPTDAGRSRGYAAPAARPLPPGLYRPACAGAGDGGSISEIACTDGEDARLHGRRNPGLCRSAATRWTRPALTPSSTPAFTRYRTCRDAMQT